ncbi:MAG: bifunctional homocysteine S-methyltransferase/methylenetetrahydrofolate reductase [Deltaproteobacteria bacterium RIFCSPLOWO2_02_FULL_44_10]|nr:MAG: bifunctional homocysteine S-methyltransferase/methylenetetrahydrofolate reductase [Deltaproteobacteria bacterium RIFCSPHIGHO2_02_FULL_44_16]OGQ45532.1 MAG: bifunctional homocysteine S-methyltransferase/methylenetetrahydrofolate reductase [Deltaproteobacteria bacterium RIFCSPLOWO2_02_FULL_44_10]
MKRDFLTTLTEKGILADGAMGTELYRRGIFINRCYDELCLSSPEIVKEIHREYVSAGAELIETNTFTANRLALSGFGLETKVREINMAGATLARAVAGENIFVAGSVGPVSWTKKNAGVMDPKEIHDAFAEQIRALADGGVDAIFLETFTRLDELKIAYEAARSVTSLPIVCHLSLKYGGEGEFEGLQPEVAAEEMDIWGADVIGVNCSDGPIGVFEALKRMTKVTKKPLSAMPNAGLPQMEQGRLLYMATPQYVAEYARRFAQLGVKLIGGCCGTTAAHIHEMKNFIKAIRVDDTGKTKVIKDEQDKPYELHQVRFPSPIPVEEKSPFGALLGKKFSVSVEIEPPVSTDPSKALEGAMLLKEIGVDAINISDGPRAMARMSSTAMSLLIKERVGIEVITHYCCRDRNLLGIQMDLIGANALGLRNLMLITGDPPKMGNYPEATAVFDIDAIGLIKFAANLNRGLDFAGRPIKGSTKFLLGCGVNPGAVDIDLEVDRFARKVAAGAEFVFSQPVYEVERVEEFFKRIHSIPKIPIFVGILPLTSLRSAEFLHNEVPGMQIPKKVMSRMESAKTTETQRQVGMSVASEMLEAIHAMKEVTGGAYIFPPFRSYAAIGDLLNVIR